MNQLFDQLINLIKEKDLDTRKETWDNLFLWVDFSRMKEEYPNMWSKEFKLLPLPKPYGEVRKKFSEYCGKLNQEITNLIESYRAYFNSEILPVLQKPEGDKTLLFRCKRLLDNKVIGESSGLFLDLVIWEVEWRQVEGFKELVRQLSLEPMFLTDREDELFMSDCEKMIEGRINYGLAQRFFFKWSNLVQKSGVQKEEWEELGNYLKLWQVGKGAESEWRENLERMKEARDNLFMLGSESINDGLPFFQLGFIKSDSEEGLEIVSQNRKGFNLGNPYLRVIWLHQKVVRMYVVKKWRMVDGKRLYVRVWGEEDWVWKDYSWIISSSGKLTSQNHMIYHRRNLS